ncbi:flagellar biosynthesis protein FlgA [Loktanella sp. 3ANDIMAR09]|uniref:flagellar basal body P-ring formation chaperone FlgA n=1 Tax=Loktanella sp. 3ANDIMAR09 TaxID=1225657 RepID=UPI0006FDFF90|nr:flagellar basal body P-ring formation chaperone FlgA [Loktanella sp. 3ANDIMAR09]KQI69941.1 flagellar biosynthesis protein FlgA [Loktanella sp. 3ANDIMAR09]
MTRWLIMALLLAAPAQAETIVAARNIPAQTLIGPDDLLVSPIDVPGGTDDPLLLVGMEARTALYAGRPVRPADVGFPAIVDRNQLITLIYDVGGLLISTEGRALGRAGEGEVIRVMNMASRATVSARISAEGTAHVAR